MLPATDRIELETAKALQWIWADHALSYIGRKCFRGYVWSKIWWKCMIGTIIVVKWPRGVIEVGPNSWHWDGVSHGGCRQEQMSADPNDHYRPELEAKVGVQGIDWDWEIGNCGNDSLNIKIRKGKTKWCSYFALKWGW